MDADVPESRVSLENIASAVNNLAQHQQRVDESAVELSELEIQYSAKVAEERTSSAQLLYEIKVLFNQFLSSEADGLVQPLYLSILRSSATVWDKITI
jgi:hypothetical protein